MVPLMNQAADTLEINEYDNILQESVASRICRISTVAADGFLLFLIIEGSECLISSGEFSPNRVCE